MWLSDDGKTDCGEHKVFAFLCSVPLEHSHKAAFGVPSNSIKLCHPYSGSALLAIHYRLKFLFWPEKSSRSDSNYCPRVLSSRTSLPSQTELPTFVGASTLLPQLMLSLSPGTFFFQSSEFLLLNFSHSGERIEIPL